MRTITRNLLGLLAGAGFLTTLSISPAAALNLTLINGWTNAPFSTGNAAVNTVNGVVHFSGAIATTGTNATPFVLPAQYAPSTEVYVKVDLCGAANGRLQIDPSGTVTVETEGAFSDAQCFTSLDGASFALSPTNYKLLTLKHGWTGAPFGTNTATLKSIDGIVHLSGAIASGTNENVFKLPAKFRPATEVYVPVDMCDATNGRLDIATNGVVDVEAESGTFSNAQCFTSLDGVSFAQNATGFTALSLINGWTNTPFGTANAAVRDVNGIVQFEGAIATTGTNPQPFVLPVGFRPSKEVYVYVDLCNATNGRIQIDPSGNVTVEAATFSNAQCLTSLDGASFKL